MFKNYFFPVFFATFPPFLGGAKPAFLRRWFFEPFRSFKLWAFASIFFSFLLCISFFFTLFATTGYSNQQKQRFTFLSVHLFWLLFQLGKVDISAVHVLVNYKSVWDFYKYHFLDCDSLILAFNDFSGVIIILIDIDKLFHILVQEFIFLFQLFLLILSRGFLHATTFNAMNKL